ncbi:S26 family signal peptidase [Desulfogranum marinum]|uniref:S26 family signal peptidase n=1 Tax=Desulfogranum marinum TaxID=453220 RepID=UPI001963736A|nr:S26 family signal peptidase [Desulfogranum marinum]MBM9514071.1 S26 family signal peptidase [Desulfogranum marinum]
MTNKKPFWYLSRQEQTVILVLLAAMLVGTTLPSRIIVATSDSLDRRVFFKVPVTPSRIQRGDYLLFPLHGEEHRPFLRQGITENHVLIKKVGCVPGDLLTKESGGVFSCQQSTVGKALVKDSHGHVLPVFSFNGPVPQNSYFMMGTNPRSYDSRYFGFIHGDAFIAKALPLW